MVYILTSLTTYKLFWSKITASCCVMYVTLIRLPFKHEMCDQYHLLLADMCIFQNVLIILYYRTHFGQRKSKFCIYTLNIVSYTCN